MDEKTAQLPPLTPGDVAVRFRTDWRSETPRAARSARPVCIGLQAVWIVAIQGESVTWTNGNRSRKTGVEFRHTSDRRELIALAEFETLTPEFLASLVAEISVAASEEEHPALTAERGESDAATVQDASGSVGNGDDRSPSTHPWYARDLDEPIESEIGEVVNR